MFFFFPFATEQAAAPGLPETAAVWGIAATARAQERFHAGTPRRTQLWQRFRASRRACCWPFEAGAELARIVDDRAWQPGERTLRTGGGYARFPADGQRCGFIFWNVSARLRAARAAERICRLVDRSSSAASAFFCLWPSRIGESLGGKSVGIIHGSDRYVDELPTARNGAAAQPL